MGAGSNLIAQGVQGGPIDWWSVGLSAGIGGVAGGVGAKIAAARSVNAGAEESPALGSGGTVQLFRHVDPIELADIRSTGEFRPGPNTTGKYFAESAEHAREWGQDLNNGEGAVVETNVPTSVASQLYRWEKLDSIGPARYVGPEQLHSFNRSIDGIRELP
jgi:hypothetical protein